MEMFYCAFRKDGTVLIRKVENIAMVKLKVLNLEAGHR